MYKRLLQKNIALEALILMLLLSLSVRGQEIEFQRITTVNGLSNNQVQHIEQLEDGRMMIVTWRGINIYDGAQIVNYPRQDERAMELPHYKQGYAAAIDSDGLVWVKEYGRLWCLDIKHGEMRNDIPALLKAEEKSLLDAYFPDGNSEGVTRPSRKQSIKPWLLTEEGLTEASSGKTIPLPCPADEIMSMEVAGNVLLLFCIDGSVQMVQDGKAQKTACPGVPTLRHVHEVRTIKGPDGKFYRKLYGDRYSRIDCFDLKSRTWQMVMEQPMVLYGMSWVNGQLIVGSRHGYFKDGRLQPSFLTENGEILEDIGVQQVFSDRRGGLWVALTDYGVLYTHPQRHRFASSNDPQKLGIADSVVWNCHTRLSALFHFTEQRDNDSHIDRQGRTWRATHNGIIVDSQHITTANGLPSNFVQSLVEDRHGRMWIGTNRGICCVEDVNPPSIVNYGVHDGVPLWDAMASSATMLDDGRIAMQFEQGWVAFHPDSVQRPAASLTPILTSCPATTRRYFENNVSLTFTTDYYAFPHSVHYLWRSNGGEWHRGGVEEVRDGQLHLNFLDLHHGTYCIDVKASSDGHTFDGDTCTFSFTILPPWWQTWWAYSLYIGCAIALATFFIRQYYRHKQQQLKQQMHEESLLKQIEMLMQAAKKSVDQTQPQEENKEEIVEEKEEELSPEDSEFVQRAIALVHEHISDNYTVEQMAADLCMERTGLYKRLTALVNQSPQIFIRSIRLNRAVEMMKRGDSITEAAYAAGFNSVSYFGRCFTKEFGCSPSEYMKNA